MDLTTWLRNLFSFQGATPADVRKVPSASESELLSSLLNLPAGERAWITLTEAAHLFSNADPQYAFGELDDPGKRHLREFAEKCRCDVQFMPVEGRVYFAREQ